MHLAKLGVPALAGWLLTLPARGAERWELQYFYDKNDSTLSLLDLQFPSAQRGVALGAVFERNRRKPVVVVTANGGQTWDLLPLKEIGRSLFFLNAQIGWMISERGRLWKTQEAGRSWAPVRAKGVKGMPLRVFFIDESVGWLLCAQKQIYSTRDGGQNWQLLEASQRPAVPAEQTLYATAAFSGPLGLLAGWSQAPVRRSRFPDWMEADEAPSRRPATGVVLATTDRGQTWKFRVFEKFGQVARALWSGQTPLFLVQRPEAMESVSRIVALDLPALEPRPVYNHKDRWLTDIAFVGQRLLAAGVAQQGNSPRPTIPSRLAVLERSSAGWTEMAVDYRAEARRAVLAAADGAHAWIATDTGMILKLVDR